MAAMLLSWDRGMTRPPRTRSPLGQVRIIDIPTVPESHAIYSDGLQVGGGINDRNAESWLKAGANKVRTCMSC
jgi:hypothetical protein